MNRSHLLAGVATLALLGGGTLLTASADVQPAVPAHETGDFVPITPCRLIDTRADSTVGPRSTPVAADETYVARVRGTNGNCTIPAEAVGISFNVAIVNPSSASFLTVFPADAPRPLTANLNWVAHQAPTPNAVNVALSSDGRAAFYNLTGTVDLAVDVVGYYAATRRLNPVQVGRLGWTEDPLRPLELPVPGHIYGMTSDGTHLWALDTDHSTALAFDRSTGHHDATVPVGNDPQGIAFDGRDVWVASNATNTVTRIAPATGATTTVDLGPSTAPVRVAADGAAVYVAGQSCGCVRRVDRATLAVTTPVTGIPSATAVLVVGGSLWVGSATPNRLTRVDLATFVAAPPIPLAGQPGELTTDGQRLWTIEGGFGGHVEEIDPDQGLVMASTAGTFSGIAYDGRNVWLADFGAPSLDRIDAVGLGVFESGLSAGAGFSPADVFYDGRSLWVASFAPVTLWRFPL